jgi:hypothetical protein
MPGTVARRKAKTVQTKGEKQMSRLREKTTATLLITVFLFSIVVPVSFAGTGRFTGYTYLYMVVTQADVNGLPKTIDATGYEIGILVDGSGLVLDDFTISGATEHAIAVDGQTDVTVSNSDLSGGMVSLYYYASSGSIAHNSIHTYLKNGITANMPSSDGSIVDIKWNTVTGRGPLGLGDYAQNGIQLGWGATGNIMFNDVSDHWYTAADWAASGILIFESDECSVQSNTLTDNQAGVAVETWGWLGEVSSSNNKIVKNTIEDGQVGVSIAAYELWTDTGNPTADNNKVSNNVITGQGVGVSIEIGDYGTDYVASADNNKVTRNEITNTGTEINDEGTSTKMHANVFP